MRQDSMSPRTEKMSCSIRLAALSLVLAAAVSAGPAVAQECVSCWTERCPDLKGYLKRCEETLRKPVGTKPVKAAPPEEPGCKGGRVEVDGHCCWPGQDYGVGSGKCIGAPECPEGMKRQGEGCVVGCDAGKVLMGTHCCWLGQDWASKAQRCVGEPRCPAGQEFRQGDCRPQRPFRKMVRLEGGSYMMGETKQQVTVTSFLLDETEVTVGQYAACERVGGCRAATTGEYCNGGKPDRQDHPVNCVSWDEAGAYCEWASARLPTEEEWEWAARGGSDGTTYPWGNGEPRDRLCWSGGSLHRLAKRLGTCAVGEYPTGNSPQGVKDMAGNVLEWTSSGELESIRVYRGGSWNLDYPGGVSAAARGRDPPSNQNSLLGFRCARTQ